MPKRKKKEMYVKTVNLKAHESSVGAWRNWQTFVLGKGKKLPIPEGELSDMKRT